MSTTRRSPSGTPERSATEGANRSQPIGAYGLPADCNTAALADREGAIDWLCVPRYDSPALFARILDPEAGHWSIRPVRAFTTTRRYLPGTLVLETIFQTDDGVVALTDALAFAEGQRGHQLGHDAPRELLRLVQGLSGQVALVMELVPRPEYGLVHPLFRRTEYGGRTFGGPDQIAICAGVPVELEDAAMRAEFQLGEGERAEALFDRLVGYANDLGLLAEEVDTANGELLGNFPQAFSHIGLINAAWQLDKAREGASARVTQMDAE
jgi:GH15 family glucan-1,4-alpha-glucosidase